MDLSFWILPICLVEFAEHGLHCKFHQHLVLTTLTCVKSWMVGPSWPTNGEIDIIEGVNSTPSNSVTLHTNAGCSISNYDTPYSGTLMTSNCDVDSPGQAMNAGCLIVPRVPRLSAMVSMQFAVACMLGSGLAQRYPYISSREMQFQHI
jgi:hypothetical protein